MQKQEQETLKKLEIVDGNRVTQRFRATRNQAKHIANCPFVDEKVFVLPNHTPDVGTPRGSVFTTVDTIVPSAVGGDVGCGILFARTNTNKDELKGTSLRNIAKKISESTRMGESNRNMWGDYNFEDFIKNFDPSFPLDEYALHNVNNTMKHIGILGMISHFVYLLTDEDDFIWIVVHAGPSYFGHLVTSQYIRLAKKMNSRYYSLIPNKWNLNFLNANSKEGIMYLREYEFCREFGKLNRRYIFSMARNAIQQEINKSISYKYYEDSVHNSISVEKIENISLIIHRKNASHLPYNSYGIILGKPNTEHLFIKSNGNKYYDSYPVGTPRVMTRSEANKNLNAEQQSKKINDKLSVNISYLKSALFLAPDAFSPNHIIERDFKQHWDVKYKLYPFIYIY